jgi:regulator of sigma E protease
MIWLLWKVIVPVLILGVLILIHELGHFLVAKKCKVGVVSFSIGFGPGIISKKIGHTLYKIAPIPLGGYVQMVGEDPSFALDGTPPVEQGVETSAEEARRSVAELRRAGIPPELLADKSCWFINKTLLQRTAIVAAGPLFNLISAYIFVFIMLVGYGDESPSTSPIIGNVSQNSPAEIAGIRPGDTVKKLNGNLVQKWEDFSSGIRSGGGKEVTLIISRPIATGGPNVVAEAVPNVVPYADPNAASGEFEVKVLPEIKKIQGQELYLIGVRPEISKKFYSFGEAFVQSAEWIYDFSLQTLKGLGGMIIGQVSPKELAGPLAILDAAGDHAERGFANTLYFMSILSISLAILNLLPIPILDGGHLLFFLIEAIFGPVSLRKREIANQVGLAFLLLFMGVALTNDIRRVDAPKEKADAGVEWTPEKAKAADKAKEPEIK